jgi:hypothetical protein
MRKLHMNVGGVNSLAFIISKCLDALHMSMFSMTDEEIVSQNPFGAYLLDMITTRRCGPSSLGYFTMLSELSSL